MRSDKTAVIEYLFRKYWDEESKYLIKSVMSLSDVAEAIRACNKLDGLDRSDRNPANFLKDVVRSKGASRIWPEHVAALRFTGRQRTGAGECFEFVPYEVDQDEPFPDLFRADAEVSLVALQSLSLPRAAKALGRNDEAWLIQTAVNLRVVEQHIATQSDLEVREITHLQMNVKLRATEIDAIYLAEIGADGDSRRAIITCEAKNEKERILVDQISNQVLAAFAATSADVVIPLAIRSVRKKGIQVIEFCLVERSQIDAFDGVRFVKSVVYELVPPVPGI